MDDVALELEHSIGFTANLQGIAYHPSSEKSVVAFGCGKLLNITDLDQVHDQRLLRGHSNFITCVDISPSGKYIVSGQKRDGEGKTLFNLWNYETSAVIRSVQTPHDGEIDALRFSPDESLLVSTGGDGQLCVWEISTMKIVGTFRDSIGSDRARSVTWGKMTDAGTRNQRYEFFATFNTGVRSFCLSYDIRTLSFKLEHRACSLPGAGGRMGGFTRSYNCCTIKGDDLLCGTSTGDVLVFSVESGAYRTALTLCSNGVSSCVYVPKYDCVLVGGGDGRVKKITGSGKQWILDSEVELNGPVVSVAPSADGHQVVVMTSSGVLYRILVADLSFHIAAEAPLGGLTATALSPNRPDLFATASKDGLLRLWDLSTYSILSSFSLQQTAKSSNTAQDHVFPTSCTFDPDDELLLMTGWSDGRIRAVSMKNTTGSLSWALPNGHKGGVHTVRVCSLYFISAGEDSCVRVWSRSTRELTAQLQDHKLRTSGVLIDNTTANIVHTVSMDKTVMTYDLGKNDANFPTRGPKRVAVHADKEGGGITCVCQRHDHEHEVIVGTTDGKIVFFDMDYDAPVFTLVDKQRIGVTSLRVSPNGRHFVAGLADGNVLVYAIREGSTQCTLVLQAQCHSAHVVCCEWSCDGRQIISTGADGEIILWNFYTK